MTSTVAPSTTIIPGEPIEKSQAPTTPLYRTGKPFAVVQFGPGGKGRVVFLPEGAEVRIVGPSGLAKCFEVMFENQVYNIFKVDLLGPWATPIKPIRSLKAASACA